MRAQQELLLQRREPRRDRRGCLLKPEEQSLEQEQEQEQSRLLLLALLLPHSPTATNLAQPSEQTEARAVREL
jgi:hypothetical protein